MICFRKVLGDFLSSRNLHYSKCEKKSNLEVKKLLNACSVRNKCWTIHHIITDSKTDILWLPETSPNKDETAVFEELDPESHSFIESPRDGRGGVVGIAYAKCLTVTESVFEHVFNLKAWLFVWRMQAKVQS